MSDLGIAVYQLGGIFTGLVNVYIWVVIISALLTFVNPDPFNPIVQFLDRVTQPVYAMVRKKVNTYFNGLDLAPFIIIIGLQVLIVLLNLLFSSIAHAL